MTNTHRVFNVGDEVRLIGSYNYEGEVGVIREVYTEDRYSIFIPSIGTRYFIHARYLRLNSSSYDGNKIVPWNTCHWKPGSFIVTANYKTAKALLLTIMESIQHNKKKENKRGN